MACCGNQRAAARRATTTFAPTTVHSAPRRTTEAAVYVRYVYAGEVAVRGAISGRVYYFTSAGSTLVARSDARVLVASGQFVAVA